MLPQPARIWFPRELFLLTEKREQLFPIPLQKQRTCAHTHSHTHTHTHTCTCPHKKIQAYAHTHETNACTSTQTHTHRNMHAHKHAFTVGCVSTCVSTLSFCTSWHKCYELQWEQQLSRQRRACPEVWVLCSGGVVRSCSRIGWNLFALRVLAPLPKLRAEGVTQSR